MVDGETYFVGKDVASALGYKNSMDALMRHVDDDVKLGSGITTSGQNREMIIINESGLYSLILSSKLESAKRFKRWVTSEVLPQIRKNGRYELEQHDEQLGSLIPMRAIQFPPKRMWYGTSIGIGRP